MNSWLARGGAMAAAVWKHPANRKRRVRSMARLLAWQFTKHVLNRPVTIPFHRMRLRCYPDSAATSGVLYFSGYPDFWEMKFMQAYLRPGDGFLDIGANTGVYSILAASCIGRQATIDAFEPVEATAARLEEQATLNGLAHMRVHRLAVWDRNAELDFGFSDSDATMHLRRRAEESTKMLRVQTVALDAFEAYGQYAAGKMDIEGAEPMALRGALGRMREANPPVWLLELAGYSTCYGLSSDEIVQQLAESGFECAVYDPDSRALRNTQAPWELGVQNVLAISRPHRAQVEQRLASPPAT